MYKTGCRDACNWYSFQYYGNNSLCVMPMYLSECAGFHHLGGSVRDVQADQRCVEVFQAVCLGHGGWQEDGGMGGGWRRSVCVYMDM